MKKILFTAIALLLSAGLVFAQSDTADSKGNSSLADPDPNNVGADSAASALREVSLDKFERDGSWNIHISPDAGLATVRLFEGSPAAKVPLEGEEEQTDTHALGCKIEFFRRGVNSIYITAVRPIPIEGITKTVSVWIAGRNQNHDIYLLVQDYYGHDFELYLGNLGFSGWKRLSTAVPPSIDGEHGIIQASAYHGDRPGLRIRGFRIDCNPMLARGTYFVYFDDLRAVTDLYDMENRDEDDMVDNW